MEDLIRKSDAIKAYNDAMDELVKSQMEEWELGDFSECEFDTTQCKLIARKIESVPAVESNLLITPETIERGSEVFIGEDIVVVHHDDFIDMQCKAKMWDEYGQVPTPKGVVVPIENGNVVMCENTYEELIEEAVSVTMNQSKQGEWLYWNYKCSCCGKALMDYFIYTEDGDIVEAPNYCPNCGARMKGTDNNDYNSK